MCRLSVFRANACDSYMCGLLSDKRKVSRKIEQALSEIPSLSFLEDPNLRLYVRYKKKPLRELFLEVLKSDSKECRVLNPNSLLGIAIESEKSLKEVIAEKKKYLEKLSEVHESNSKDFDKVSQIYGWMFWIIGCKMCFFLISISLGLSGSMWNVLSILMGLGVLCVSI